jgi:hypothetical protein
MGQPKVSPGERIASSFKRLAASSSNLSTATDEFTEVVAALETPLKSIRPQVAAWHQIAGSDGDEYGCYWHRDIGYAQVGEKWGIALRTVDGHEAADHDEIEVFLFNDAPSWMQIESVGKLPDLFDELIKRTEETTRKLQAKTAEAKQMAAALTQAIAELDLAAKSGSEEW